MFNLFVRVLVPTALLSLALPCYAEDATTAKPAETQESAKPAEATKSNETKKIGVVGSINWGIGSMKNENDSIPKRTMDTLELSVLPGYKFTNLLVGPFLSYRIAGQVKDPAVVGDQNLKGSGYLLGLGGSYLFTNNFTAMLAVDFLGQYKLGKKDLSDNTLTYKNPFGFHLGGGYRFLPNWSGDVVYSHIAYKKVQIESGTSTDISKLKHWNLAFGISYYY